MTQQVQSVVFSSQYYNIQQARKWLKDHGYIHDQKVDKTPHTIRFRQKPPNYKRYFTQKITPSIDLIIGVK